jgi:tetratricopeptide (TPR) repeat protein
VRIAAILLSIALIAEANTDPALAGLASALASHKIDEVHSWEQRLLSNDTSAETLLSAGALLGQHDMLRDAAAVFEKCAQRFPDLFEAKYNLALAWIGLNDFPSAQKALDAMSPSSAQAAVAKQYLQGKVYAATGRIAEARQSLEKAYQSNPSDENYALDLALIYIRSSAYFRAIRVLEPALRRHSESEDLAIELGLANALAGRKAEALTVCRKVLARNPQLPTPRLIAAFADCLAADYKACAAEAAAGLRLPEANPYLHYLYGEALWNANPDDISEALAELNLAVTAMPSCRACLLLRSRLSEAAADYRGAIADVTTVLQQDPASGPAWYRLAALRRKTGDSRGAAEALSRYSALHQQQTDQEVESFREQFLRAPKP